MALSQVQCLDNYHINLRTTASKPEFLYSEDQRLALEMLLQTGQDAFEDYIKTNNIRSFLSDIELERFLNNAEVFSPGYPDDATDGCEESQGGEVSLQYWPERSDRSTPRLDIGWPDRVSYRGVTRVQVYTQPANEGQPHIKEVVRKMISHAQKVIAIVMDLFTDIDIFKDLLDASYRRKVAVYIILDTTGVKHFMRMCEKAEMHSGHLKACTNSKPTTQITFSSCDMFKINTCKHNNLRVRCIRGSQFFSRSSKRLCGSQSQKFMFIDGDKAVSGSYSFTWSASRLDRNLITVLRGQAVETFDTLFQDMYMLSNGVCLSRLHFSNEPEPEDLPQVVPTVLLSSTQALKLINPKYSLVSNCAFTTIGSASGLTSGEKSASKKQTEFFKPIKDTKVSNIHPGLLNLEKANMIHYIPTWPDPEPPSDVIGFINIRDSNKPLQAHLTRSELYEISQAVRFKDPTGSSPLISQVPPDSESRITPVDLLSGDPIRISEKQDAVIVFECNEADIKELNLTEKDLDTKSRESKEDHSDGMPSFSKDSTILDPKQIQDHLQPPKCRSSMSDEYYECLSPESVEDEGTDSWLNPVINGEQQDIVLNRHDQSPHGRSVELDKADFTSAFQKPVDLPTSEELKVLASGNVGSKNRIIAKHEEHDNYNLRVHNYGVTPVVMKGNSNMDNHQKKLQDHLESTKLVIVKNDSDAVRSKGAQLTSKSDSKEPKANGEEKKLGQQVCGWNGKKICYPTAQALEKREVEHIQMNTRMPEAQLKREFLGRKQPYQASSKIPVHSRRRLTKFPIAIPDSCRNFFGLGPPKDGVYKLGKARELKSVSITPSPSAQKVPKGAIRTTKIPQRSTWMVPPTNSHHSPPKHQKFHPDN
ncbi:hypothetical protein DNTS_008380 [Danionella cerebrum]|uniref:Scaffolding anchor of CK1 domain-containing protein n=1 Tax=Danionella cerebrum TaxID=2873325 RepID=A0A553N0T7_9TELE|nr:hypothetical protein DNTS_008380 [Danionella translucida]